LRRGSAWSGRCARHGGFSAFAAAGRPGAISPKLAIGHASGGRPFRSHLCQTVHVDRHAVAGFFVGERFQQIDRAIEILLDRRLGGGVIEAFDLGNRVHSDSSIAKLSGFVAVPP
jgi:hypothetical protein